MSCTHLHGIDDPTLVANTNHKSSQFHTMTSSHGPLRSIVVSLATALASDEGPFEPNERYVLRAEVDDAKWIVDNVNGGWPQNHCSAHLEKIDACS